MQIARLQNEKSLAEITAKLYDLKPGDARAATAEKALLAANPHLAGNPAALPPGTPVVVPSVPGLSIAAFAPADPQTAAWMSLLDRALESAKQASNAQATGLATTAPKSPDPQRTKALALLHQDIAQFKKLHTG